MVGRKAAAGGSGLKRQKDFLADFPNAQNCGGLEQTAARRFSAVSSASAKAYRMHI